VQAAYHKIISFWILLAAKVSKEKFDLISFVSRQKKGEKEVLNRKKMN